jgi:hypothetical protein
MSAGITQGPWVGGSEGCSGSAPQIFVDGIYLYFGTSNLDGSWRQSISGTDMVFERREASVWVLKYTIAA